MVTIFSEAFSQVIVCITFENSFQRYNNRGNTDLHIPLFISSLPVVLCQTQALEEAAKNWLCWTKNDVKNRIQRKIGSLKLNRSNGHDLLYLRMYPP